MSEESKHSRSTYISYGIGGFVDNFFIAAFSVRIIDFYVNELLLGIFWVALAFLLYGFWNMVNDPLIGWFTDKKFKFTKRLGRRYPFFAIGALSFVWIYLFIFTVPFTDQIGMFVWLLIMICIFEFLYSLFLVSYMALIPEKFRSIEERTKIGAQNTAWGVFGIVLGVLIPSFIIVYGDVFSFIIAAVVVSIIGFIMALLSLHGVKEDEALIERQIRFLEAKKEEDSFWKVLNSSLREKNFVAYILVSLGHAVMTVMMLSSLPFWNKYIIGSTDPEIETVMVLGFLVASLISVPFWTHFGRKLGNKKAITYGTLISTILFIPFFFVSDLITTTILFALIGFGLGAFWVLMFPNFSDVVDDIVVKTGKRQEGTLSGIRIFTERISLIILAISFATILPLTGYIAGADPGQTSQTPLAQLGIRFLIAGIPMIFYFIAFLLIWKVYDLDKAKVAENAEIIKQKQL